MGNKSSIKVHRPKTKAEYERVDREMRKKGFMSLDAIKLGGVHNISLGDKDPSDKEAKKKQEAKTEAKKPVLPATEAKAAAETGTTAEGSGEDTASVSTQDQGNISSGSNFGAFFSILIALITVILLFFCVLIL